MFLVKLITIIEYDALNLDQIIFVGKMGKIGGSGALPPASSEWQIGKTPASIGFVKDAEAHIKAREKPIHIETLKRAIKAIKDGKWIIYVPLKIEKFLAQAGCYPYGYGPKIP